MSGEGRRWTLKRVKADWDGPQQIRQAGPWQVSADALPLSGCEYIEVVPAQHLDEAQADKDEAYEKVVELHNDALRERDRADQARARVEEAELERARWQGSFEGIAAVEKELRGRVDGAEQTIAAVREELERMATAFEERAVEAASQSKPPLSEDANHFRSLAFGFAARQTRAALDSIQEGRDG